jgi:hypothetical protein
VSEDKTPDEEDTISVPLPKAEREDEAELIVSEEVMERTAINIADVVSALESVGRTISVLAAEFEHLRKIIEGEDGSVTHSPPEGHSGLTPCCKRSVLDIPMTERISFDGAGITCQGAQR